MNIDPDSKEETPLNLLQRVLDGGENLLDKVSESVWIDVIKKMDEAYAELIESQVELEQKNTELEEAHRELKQTQEQLIQSEKMASLGRLVAGVAHELNNPISFVYSNVFALKDYSDKIKKYLLAENNVLSTEQLEKLRHDLDIDFLTNDLTSLIEGTLEGAERVRDIVLELSQFSASKRENRVKFNLVQVIRTAVQWVGKESSKKYNLIENLPQQLLVSGHPGQIQQVMMNLFQNAIDSFENKTDNLIEVSAAKRGGDNVVTIRDNGPGISEENQKLIFEPFFTTKSAGKGIGLGLSISFGIISKHGGSLSVSNHKEGGACFKIRFPQIKKTDQENLK